MFCVYFCPSEQNRTEIRLLVVAEVQYNNAHTHPFNGTTWVSRYQKGNTNLDFTEARDSEWQWHQLGHMQVCTSLQKDNHASTPPLSFYRPDALPAAQPTVSKHWWHIALKAYCSTICCNNNKKATTNGWTINDTLNHPLLQCLLWNEIIFPIVVRGKFLFWSIQMRSSSSFHLQSTAG